jgi:hypothetical protein
MNFVAILPLRIGQRVRKVTLGLGNVKRDLDVSLDLKRCWVTDILEIYTNKLCTLRSEGNTGFVEGHVSFDDDISSASDIRCNPKCEATHEVLRAAMKPIGYRADERDALYRKMIACLELSKSEMSETCFYNTKIILEKALKKPSADEVHLAFAKGQLCKFEFYTSAIAVVGATLQISVTRGVVLDHIHMSFISKHEGLLDLFFLNNTFQVEAHTCNIFQCSETCRTLHKTLSTMSETFVKESRSSDECVKVWKDFLERSKSLMMEECYNVCMGNVLKLIKE